MAVPSSPLENRLEQVIGAEQPQDDMTQLAPLDNSEDRGNAIATGDSVDVGEPVLVAGAPQALAGKMKEVLEPLTRKGARMARDAKIVEPPPVTPPPVAAQPAAVVKPAVKAPTPVKATEMMDLAKQREAGIAAGGPMQAPSPTAQQIAAGVEEAPISTLAFDNVEMRSMVSAATDRALQDTDYGTMTVRSMFQRAVDAGVPESTANRILQGIPLESKIGDNELTKNLAGLIKLHDDSASQLDSLFDSLSKGQLDDAGKLDLRQRMAFHDTVVKQLKGVQVDVARSMNAFKRVRDAGPRFKPTEIRTLLDELGGDKALLDIANAYMMPGISRKTKNQLLEEGLGAKSRDVWIFTFMANLLNDVSTHAVNAVGGALQIAASPVERAVAIPIGMAREALPNSVKDRYYMGDILAQTSAFYNGSIDAWIAASHFWKTGERLGFKGDVRPNPISAQALSDVPIRTGNIAAAAADVATTAVAGMPLPVSPIVGSWADAGKEIWRTPDLTNTWAGKLIDGLGYIQGLPLRALTTADEFMGTIAARMKLHEEVWRFQNEEYDKLIAAGMPEADATREVTKLGEQFLNERPRDMQASVEKFRAQATLSDRFDRDTKLGEAYWKLDNVMQIPVLKAFNPFQRAISQLFIEGTARVPGLNFVSPRFHEEWSKGGRYRDLAMARVAIGGSAASITAYMALNNRITGSGPDAPEDRAAMIAQGWQPRSFILDSDEISPENMERINKAMSVTKGKGPFEGKVFVSFARFDPVSVPLSIGADIGDMLKFHKPKPGDDAMDENTKLIQDLVTTGAVATAEYMAEHPTAATFGDLLRIFRGKFADKGEQLAAFADRMAAQYANFLFTGTPVIGAANSTAMAHIERLTDPTIRSTKADVMDAPYGLRAVYELRQRVMSRLPGWSKDVPPELDNLGRERQVATRGIDYPVNWVPFITASKGKISETDQLLASIDHGINVPQQTWNGVRLSASQYQRFKELYGQKIRFMPDELGIDLPEATKPVNLEQAIPLMLKFAKMDAQSAGIPFHTGDAQQEVDKLVTKYREAAKKRMIGIDSGDRTTPWEPTGSMMGLPNDRIEFPELQQLIRRNRDHETLYGR